MSYQSEAALEQQFIDQLSKQGYTSVSIPDYDTLVENFKAQFAAFNASKLDHPLTDKEWERVFNIMLGKSIFQIAGFFYHCVVFRCNHIAADPGTVPAKRYAVCFFKRAPCCIEIRSISKYRFFIVVKADKFIDHLMACRL